METTVESYMGFRGGLETERQEMATSFQVVEQGKRRFQWGVLLVRIAGHYSDS